MGTRQEDIATVIGISLRTLTRNYREELDRGAIEANSRVAQSLFQIATNVDEEGKREKGAVTAAIFWLKVRARWKETSVLEHVDATPVTAQDAHDELKRLIGKHKEAAADRKEHEEAEEAAAALPKPAETNGATNGHVVPRKKGTNGVG